MAVPTQNILSLCSGVGGLELGLHLARPDLRTVCYVEREAYAASVLVAQMAAGTLDDAPIWSDVLSFEGTGWRGQVQGIVGGFPCQPWSVAGKRKGTADERWIWNDIARIVDEIQPEWCFFENVPGLVRGGLPLVLNDLAFMGFDAEWGVFSASEVGAPHRRSRLYILAYSNRDRLQRQRDSGLQHSQWQALGHDVDGRSSEATAMGYPTSVGRREGWSEHEFRSGWNTVAESSRDVGDTDSAGLEGRQRSEQRGTDEWIAGQTSSPLADTASVFRIEVERSGPYRNVGGFPPRPDDVLWANVPEVLEPAVCRVAYGVADRVDRLRACGNGVVPLAAANAYRTLAARLGI